jgi:hypothetical protein
MTPWAVNARGLEKFIRAPQAIDIVELSGRVRAPLLDHSFPVLAALRSVAFESLLELVCKQCKLCHTFNLVFPFGALLVLGLDGSMPSRNDSSGIWSSLIAGREAGTVNADLS